MSFKWRLYYDDGSTFSDTDGAPHDSPMFPSVQMVAQVGVRERLGYPNIVEGKSFFLYRIDLPCWLGFEQETFLHDEWVARGHLIDAYRKGREIGENEYRDIWNRARADLGLKLQE